MKKEYSVSSKEFKASDIIKDIKKDFNIYTFSKYRHKKTFSSSKLIRTLNKHGISIIDKTKGLVHVRQQGSIDIKPIVSSIKKYYQHKYKNIDINSVVVTPNCFIEKLPKKYEIIFKPNAYRYNSSSLEISSLKNKKHYYFKYKIDAEIKLFKAKHNINRGKILTPIDTVFQAVKFKRLDATPLKSDHKSQIRSKKRLRAGKIIYENDVEPLPLVIKNKSVNVRLIDGAVHLEFRAKALQDGALNDYIYIKKSDGKRLKVKVVSTNQVEIE